MSMQERQTITEPRITRERLADLVGGEANIPQAFAKGLVLVSGLNNKNIVNGNGTQANLAVPDVSATISK